MDFSIVIPAFNTERYIEDCLTSILKNNCKDISFEVLVVDDCSTDSTFEIVTKYKKKYDNIIVLQTENNCGPGGARNLGVKNATGNWILFLDSDDKYKSDALISLKKFISANNNNNNNKCLDIVCFNWTYNTNSNSSPKTHFEGRIDNYYFDLDKEQLIKNYLQLKMDNSVIYLAIRRELIINNNINFFHGYHEDVDYMFFVYWYARKILYFNKNIYIKTSRSESIVNTISIKHIEGFIQAYENIKSFLEKKGEFTKYCNDYNTGLIALMATRVREIYRNSNNVQERVNLYNGLYEIWLCFKYNIHDKDIQYNKTLYSEICKYFFQIMKVKDKSVIEKELLITNYLNEVANKRWSCNDLHYSVFLRPDEIRNCCKRFFSNGELKGDVTNINLKEYDPSKLNADVILERKKELYARINRGEKSECDNCPFLEFKEWGHFEIKKLSFEYHSICNLKCTYCSETYYGGIKPQYDVNKLVNDFVSKKMLSSDAFVIWAGGEPTLERNFEYLIKNIIQAFPNTTHRVLTNSVIYSPMLADLLSKNKISIYTSIDAGRKETFFDIRKSDKLYQVMENLKKYALQNSEKITIKYIFTEGNQTLEEVYAFANLINKFDLINCNFQISYDFKEEQIEIEVLTLMAVMHKLLKNSKCSVVLFDELIWQRMNQIDTKTEVLFKSRLKQIGLQGILADYYSYESVAIWGNGEMAKLLIEKSVFFKHVKVAYFVNSTNQKEGAKYLGYEIKSPDVLLSSNIPVVIAAVQNYSTIYQSFLRLGIDKSRLIDELII